MLTRRGRRRQRAAGPRRRRTAGQGQWGTRGTGHGARRASRSSTVSDQGFFLRTRYSTTLVTLMTGRHWLDTSTLGSSRPPHAPPKRKNCLMSFVLRT